MRRRTFLKISTTAVLPSVASGVEREKPALSFGVIADPQYADVRDRGSRYYRKALEKLKTAVGVLNKHDLALVVTLGDVIDRNFESFDDIMPVYDALKFPRKFVLGNHDFDVDEADKGKVLGRLGVKKSYHAEVISDWHFIYLDETEISTYRYGDGHARTDEAEVMLKTMAQAKRPNALPWNGALSTEQMEWFSAQLEKAKQAGGRVIVFNHFPVFPLKDGHNLWNDKEVVELIEKNPNVVAYMNGHNHKGNYAVNKGCHYVNFKGMVETKDKSAFAIVRCFGNRIEIDGFEAEPDRTCKHVELTQ